MQVGILTLQGCVEPHIKHFQKLGVSCKKVRLPSDLEGLSHLVLPGGESTSMLKLLRSHELAKPLQNFAASKPLWGVCAGAILLAKKVENPVQASLELMDIKALRNFYGSQLDSFKSSINLAFSSRELEVDFIRAPLLEPISQKVQVLAEQGGSPVLLRQGNLLASSFHSELGEDPALHEFFLKFA